MLMLGVWEFFQLLFTLIHKLNETKSAVIKFNRFSFCQNVPVLLFFVVVVFFSDYFGVLLHWDKPVVVNTGNIQTYLLKCGMWIRPGSVPS